MSTPIYCPHCGVPVMVIEEFELDRMACQGGRTIEEYTGAEMLGFVACGTRCLWNLTEHPVLGFVACRHKGHHETPLRSGEGTKAQDTDEVRGR